MSRFESRNVNSPFKVDLCCNINIEVHVAMRLGELIKASGTEDKQLMALGHKLSHSMNHLVDQLDNRQWDKLSAYMDYAEEQSQDDSYDDLSYSHKAKNSLPKNDVGQMMDMKEYILSKKEL